jgi:peptidoglycan/LPS O-acetylase OafA/YrhL
MGIYSFYVVEYLILSLGCAWLIASASAGFPGVAGGIFSFAPFIYIGKISYGVYLYHLFVP